MNHDGVSAAFTLILEEIAAVEEQLAAEGAAAFRDQQYDTVHELTEAGRRLLAFREKLDALKTEWKSGIDTSTRNRFKVEPGYSIATHSKAGKTTLRVTLGAGRVLKRPTAAGTFADTIEALGLDAVRKLGLTVNGVPLVDTKRHARYTQEARRGVFIVTHSSTKAKKVMLEKVAKQLGKPLKVEII